MQRRLFHTIAAGLSILAAATTARAQMAVDTGFTYQGRMTDGGVSPTGQYDIQFTLWNDPSAGSLVGTVTADNVQVTNGLFTTRLNFGNAFTSQKRWIQLAVRPGPSTGAFTTLLPRQEVTSAPWANYALGPWETVTSGGTPFNGYYLRAGDGSYFGMDSDYGDLHVNGGNDGAFGITSDGIPSGSFNISSGGATRFTINNGTGNVGINTLPPIGVKLYVVADAGGSTALVADGPSAGTGVAGSTASGNGVAGAATTGVGVRGQSSSGFGVYGISNGSGSTAGVYGTGPVGVWGASGNVTGIAVFGTASGTARGVVGVSVNATGTEGDSTSGYGVYGQSTNGVGVYGNSTNNAGVYAQSNGVGLGGAALWAYNTNGSGIGLVSSTSSGDANTVIANTGAGDLIRCFSGAGGSNQVFTVTNSGTTITKVLQILGGSDLAEPFDVARADGEPAIEPGMVVVIDPAHPGDLKLSSEPYDGKVAGVISGANGLAPGMVMRAIGEEHADGAHPVAMTGRVWCWVDASSAPVQPGDMLTTSTTSGMAMKAADASRSHGTVIGKAMTELKSGHGLVLVLVNLQ